MILFTILAVWTAVAILAVMLHHGARQWYRTGTLVHFIPALCWGFVLICIHLSL